MADGPAFRLTKQAPEAREGFYSGASCPTCFHPLWKTSRTGKPLKSDETYCARCRELGHAERHENHPHRRMR